MDASSREEFLRSVTRIENRFGSTFHTRGPKASRSFASHLVNVAFVSYELAILCYNQCLLSERDILIAFYAGLIHDTNKLLESSLRQTADKESIKTLLMWLAPEFSESLSDAELAKIQFCVALHQESGLQGMRLLMPQDNSSVELLTEIVKFADRFDNFTSPDLSLNPNLRTSCEKVLKNIQKISGGKFAYTTLLYYLLREYRGILSEAIYEVADGLLQERYGVVPIARFTNGVVYLAKRDIVMSPKEYEEILEAILEKTLKRSYLATNIREAALKFSPTGVRFAESALNLPLRSLLDELLALAKGKDRTYNAYGVFLEGLREFFKLLLENIPKKSDDAQKLKELFFSLTSINFDQFPRVGKLGDRYQEILAKASSQKDLEELKEMAEKELAPFFHQYGGGDLGNALREYLRESFVCNGFGEPSLEQIASQLSYYGDYKSTCSICGRSSEKMIEIQAQETPNLKVQAFTNRMRGHAKREPRRMVCQLCRLQSLATKGFGHGDNTLFVVMLPTNFYPQEFIESMEESLGGARSQGTEGASDLLFQMVFGNRRKKTSRVVGHNLAYIPYSQPGVDTWQELATFATAVASSLVAKLPVQVLVTSELLLLQENVEFNERIFIKDAPPSVRRMLQYPSLWARVWDILTRFPTVTEHFYELAKQPDYLSAAAVVVQRWDEIKSKEACVELFKTFLGCLGGEIVEELRRMAELACRWAYARVGGGEISDHQYLKPFVDAVKAAKRYNPKLGEDEKDLEALVIEHVGRSLPEHASWDEHKEFSDRFLNFLRKLGRGDLASGKEILVRDFAKYRNILLGNVWLYRYERVAEKKSKTDTTREGE